MHIYFAGDHAGFEMKEKLIEFVRSLGYEVEDLGPHEYIAGDDYTDYVIPLARRVAQAARNYTDLTRTNAEAIPLSPSLEMEEGEKEVKGVVVAGSGQGEIIAMNRIRGARAALFCPCPRTNNNVWVGECNLELVKASREHNDSNIFAIGARFCTLEQAKDGIKVWLETPFSNEERHIRRLQKIERLTENSK